MKGQERKLTVTKEYVGEEMRILVTGGAGFLGSHLCEFLLDEGHEVICLDNLSSGLNSNLEDLSDWDNFSFHKCNVADSMDVDGELDWVLHLASPASPAFYQNRPIETLRAGGAGTYNALRLAEERDSKFLFASSSEIYGDPEIHPQSENYWGNVNPIGSRACYDESKRYGEALTMFFHRKYGLDTRIARIFNAYGPEMRADDGRVIPTFIVQALKGEDLTIYGDGSQTRSFCYIDDMVRGLRRLMRSSVNEPINLGNPDEVSIQELAEKVIDLIEADAGVTYEPLPEDDPKWRRPDISKARKVLGWKPEIGLEERLLRTIKHFEEMID